MKRPIASKVVACAALVLATVTIGPAKVQGGSGLAHFWWIGSNVEVSRGSYKYSNMAGFFQVLIAAKSCNSFPIDGIYGELSHWNGAILQTQLLGWNNGGYMTPHMMNSLQTTGVPGTNLLALNIVDGAIDGYGTQYYNYYTGNQAANLGWNPISSQWLFSPYNTNPSYLLPATPSRTMGSFPSWC